MTIVPLEVVVSAAGKMPTSSKPLPQVALDEDRLRKLIERVKAREHR